ncbi:MAG: hypothetical protein CK429_32500 [Mycobacterium sp.]|nr:MAG: hypothetical protein CK429_32500 [Mycobacterium sp.]
MAAWCRAEAQRHTYQDSGWTAVRVQELRDRRDGTANHIVYQSVVAFPQRFARPRILLRPGDRMEAV